MHLAGEDLLDLDPLPVGPRGRRGRPQENDGLLLALVAGKVARWGCPVMVVLRARFNGIIVSNCL